MIKTVIKRDGTKEKFQPNKLNEWAEWGGMGAVAWSAIVMQTVDSLEDECTTETIQDTMISLCLGNKSPANFKMAGKLFAGQYFKQLFGSHLAVPSLPDFYKKMKDAGLWTDMDYTVEELTELDKVVDHGKDLTYSYTSLKQIKQKYALQNKHTKVVYETPQFVFMRVALASMDVMPKERRLDDVKKLFGYLSDLKLNPSTPFLNGPGTGFRGYASCCVSIGGDTAESIHAMNAITYTMTVMQAGQGTYLQTRSIKDPVKKGRIEHQGKLPYYRCVNANVKANKQQSRGGSCTMHYDCLDPELEDLIRAKSVRTLDEKRIETLDYSPILHPELIRKGLRNEDWMLVSILHAPKLHELLFSPDEDLFRLEYNRVLNDKTIPKKIVSAREILLSYGKVRGENGRLFRFNPVEANKHTPFKDTIYSSNLCFTGDTKVAVADGRNSVSIQELAEQSKGKNKFLVYSARPSRSNNSNRDKWITEIKEAVAFHNGYKEIVEVKLSDGSSFRCTEDHKLALTKANEYIEAKDSKGLELQSFFTSLGKTRKYRHINSSSNGYSKQHYMIWSHYNGKPEDDMVIDHIINEANDSIDNLQLLAKEEHFKKTGKETSGLNNARHKIYDTEGYNHNRSCLTTFDKNPNFSGMTNEYIFKLAQQLFVQGEKITITNLRKLDKNVPVSFSKNRFNGSIKVLRELVESNESCPEIEYPEMVEVKKKDIYTGNGRLFVEDIIYTGEKEDVYDLTVDDNHNFYIITDSKDDNDLECSGVLVHNCQEIFLPTKPYKDLEDLYSKESEGEIALCFLTAICEGRIEPEEREEVAYYTLLMIDNIIDTMEFPYPNMDISAKARRSVGIGMTNVAYAMAKKGVKYSTEEGRTYLHEMAELHSYSLHKASLRLAKERGPCDWAHKTKYPEGWLPIDTYNRNTDELHTAEYKCDWESLRKEIIKVGGLRNSVLEATPPCESSSQASFTTNGVYPIRSHFIGKRSGDAINYFCVPGIEDERIKDNYELVWDINVEDQIKFYAILQKFHGQGISMDIFRKFVKDIHDTSEGTGAVLLASELLEELSLSYKYGLKSIYYMNSKTAVVATEDGPTVYDETEKPSVGLDRFLSNDFKPNQTTISIKSSNSFYDEDVDMLNDEEGCSDCKM